ncbi:MAG: hypothetical protein VB948_07655 [Pseudomonadales bacterium]
MLRVTLAVATILLGACSEPFIVFAGGPLEGKVTDPPHDWSLLAEANTVQLETQPDNPYSINIWIAGIGPDCYIATDDDGTTWTDYIQANRDVRLRVEQQIFPLEAVRVMDPQEHNRVSAAYASKYGLDTDDNWVMSGQVFRLDRR